MKRRVRAAQPGGRFPPKIQKAAAHPASQAGSETRDLLLDAIDWSITVRQVHKEHIGRLAGAATLPSVVVEYEKGRYRGVDGFHRWQLAKLRGQQTIQAVVRHYGPG